MKNENQSEAISFVYDWDFLIPPKTCFKWGTNPDSTRLTEIDLGVPYGMVCMIIVCIYVLVEYFFLIGHKEFV